MSKIAAIFVMVLAGLTAGCNTVRGVGQDVGAAGDAISHVADEVQDEMEDDD